MKSIKQQYIDLTEGRMSQGNFMRNLRMTMPQYVTNVTSFGDAVKILKNKGIIAESYDNQVGQSFDLNVKSERGDGSVQNYELKNVKLVNANGRVFEKPDGTTVTLAPSDKYTSTKVDTTDESLDNFDEIKVLSKQEEPKIKSGGSLDLDLMFRDLYTKPFLGGYYLDYNFENPHRLIIHISKEPAKEGQRTNEIEKLGTAECTDGEWHFDGVKVGNNDQEILDKIASLAFPNMNEKNEPETEETNDDDAEFDAILKQLEDEMYGERATKSDVLDEPLEEESLNEGKEPKAVDENLEEVTLGIFMEHECFPDKSYDEIEKMVKKNIKKNPNYYTNYKLTGIRDYEIQTMDSSKPEDHQMKFYTEKTAVDTARGMKKIKVEKKKLKESVEEAEMRFKDLPADPEKYKMVKDSKGKIIKATNADGVEFQKGDVVKTYDGEEIKIEKFEESQGKVKAIYNAGMFYRGIDIDGLEAPKATFRPGVNIGGSFEKFKSKLAEMVRDAIAEMYDGRDNLTDISDDTK